jgi:positive regulator of sigma E activity
LTGAALYAHVYPLLKGTILKGGMLNYYTLDQLLNVNHWVVIAGLCAMILVCFYLLETYERKKTRE